MSEPDPADPLWLDWWWASFWRGDWFVPAVAVVARRALDEIVEDFALGNAREP